MVCVGDFWAASEGLDDLIIRIGRMIAYQEYNTKSPPNGLAAKWAMQHSNLLPIDTQLIAPPFHNGETAAPEPEETAATKQSVISLPEPSSDPWSEKIVVLPES